MILVLPLSFEAYAMAPATFHNDVALFHMNTPVDAAESH